MNKCFIVCNVSNKQSEYVISSTAGSNISFYLASATSKCYETEIINIGAPKKCERRKKNAFFKCDGFSIAEFPSGLPFLPSRFRAKIMLKKAIKYILKNHCKGDKILIYHSISFSRYYKKILKKSGLKDVILLVAEIYSDVGNIKYNRKREIKNASCFEKYIFMSKGIYEIFHSANPSLKSIFLYGAYKIRFDAKDVTQTDSKTIHLVYAGTASKVKGGLFNAIDACDLFGNNCILHIYSALTTELKQKLELSRNAVYEGYFSDDSLYTKMQRFDIGLATQNPYLRFNSSSFPSKIVNYLACGLSVVSTKSSSVIDSPFSGIVNFYDIGDKDSLKNAIASAYKNRNKKQNISLISKFDKTFNKELEELFKI